MGGQRVPAVGALAGAALVLSLGLAVSRPPVSGTAVASPVPPAPQIGQCLFVEPGATGDVDTPSFGPCLGAWSGEVVGVWGGDQGSAISVPIGGADGCAMAESQFIGRPDFTDPTGRWSAPRPGVAVGPDERQTAAGQDWRACVMGPPAWDADGGAVDSIASSTGPQVTTSVRNGWTDSVLRDRLGTCRDDVQGWDRPAVFCGIPHESEVLAAARWTSAPDSGLLMRGCLGQAGRMMQRADPTAAGALLVQVVTADDFWSRHVVTEQTVLADHGTAECVVRPSVPGRRLTGTLVGRGEGPISTTSE